MNKEQFINHIYNVFSSARFARWYNDGNFNAHISGEENCPSKQQIQNEIEEMFKVNEFQP